MSLEVNRNQFGIKIFWFVLVCKILCNFEKHFSLILSAVLIFNRPQTRETTSVFDAPDNDEIKKKIKHVSVDSWKSSSVEVNWHSSRHFWGCSGPNSVKVS